MKRIFTFLLSLVIAVGTVPILAFGAPNTSEMRGAWIATVYNLDFPTVKNNVQAQKKEFTTKLDKLRAAGINTVFVQVRAKADALYDSKINPWSDILTGTQGKYPGYDPLEFMIEEAHNRGMKFQAWLNPYRVTTSGTEVSALSENHPARLNPQWVLSYNGALFYDPSNAQVKKHIVDTVREIISNYSVDGIVFDDYFYPSGYPLPEGETADGDVANARREDVSQMVRMVYEAVKSNASNVEFGISPMGVWKNIDENGISFKGAQSYYNVYADTVAWINNGWVDYIAPQIYWENAHSTCPYETVLKWWNNTVDKSNVKLYVGQAVYKEAVSEEIDSHLKINEKYANVSGDIFYSAKNIIANTGGCADKMSAYYSSISGAPNSGTADEDKPISGQTQSNGKSVTAVSTRSTVMVDGRNVAFEAYNINGYNYFKLRDIAYAVNKSEKQFDIKWDADRQAINIVTAKPYTVAGGELGGKGGTNKTAVLSSARLYKNGQEQNIYAYNIDGNNYYMLRDIAKAINFAVTWNQALNTVGIVTLDDYE